MSSTVIAYHAVGYCSATDDPHGLFVSPETFAQQMEYLARRRVVVPLDAAIRGRSRTKKPAVAITFDDGYRNVLTVAAPILKSYGFEATVFVPTMWIGGRNGWMEQSICDFQIMSEKELHDAAQHGIRIESHGHAHLDMGNSSYPEIHKDIQTSVERLTETTGRHPRYLAYPWGRHSEPARRAAAQAGLEAAFSIDQPHQGIYAWDRVYIAPNDGPKTFTLKTSGHFLSWRRSRLGSSIATVTRPLRRP